MSASSRSNNRRCRWLGHKWGITTWPIGVKWCDRCGARWPKPAKPARFCGCGCGNPVGDS